MSETENQKPRVLLIDDESLVRRLFARMIRNADVDAVETAEEAMEKLQNERYDAILCDMSLPGLPGPEFYEQLRRSGNPLHKHFALVTGGATTPEHEAFLANTDVPVVMKPVMPDVLNKLVESLVQSGA